jgi:hypothetical protein
LAKYKRVLLILVAVIFLMALFWMKTGMPWNNKAIYQGSDGLSYENALVEDLIKRDGDGDGVLDWEESLLGLDPTKSETTPGTPDLTTANKLRAESYAGASTEGGELGAEENLTETDKFARELFATATALEQSGSLDQATADKMAASLAEHITNSPQGKVYTLTDLRITNDNSLVAIKKYNDSLNLAFKDYTVGYSAAEVFEKFLGDGTDMDVSVLNELDPIIKEFNSKISSMVKMEVPKFISVYHLNMINELSGVAGNLENIKMYEKDSIVALSGITQYAENTTKLETAVTELMTVLLQKLNN